MSEKSVTVGGKIGADGKAELTTECAGWYIQVGNMALYAGLDEPPFKKGDLIKLTLEHIGGPNANEAVKS